jgi:hypothetical protein
MNGTDPYTKFYVPFWSALISMRISDVQNFRLIQSAEIQNSIFLDVKRKCNCKPDVSTDELN